MRRGLVVALCFFSAVGLSTAGAFNYSNGVWDSTTFQYTIGDRFSTNDAIAVTDLGVYSVQGLANSYQVGLWNSSGVLLASATVPATSTSSQFIYVAIAPVLLDAGQTYQIGELIDSSATWLAAATVISAPEVTFIHGVYDFTFSTSLTNPTQTDGAVNPASSGELGPNFEFADVPEPSALGLSAAGIALLFLYTLSKRQRADAPYRS